MMIAPKPTSPKKPKTSPLPLLGAVFAPAVKSGEPERLSTKNWLIGTVSLPKVMKGSDVFQLPPEVPSNEFVGRALRVPDAVRNTPEGVS